MVAKAGIATPPPPSSPLTPQTPRFGYDDNYQPYSPRKSSRISAQRRRITQTPPPQTEKLSKRDSVGSSPASPATAPKKQSTPRSPSSAGRRISGALSSESTASAALRLGLPTPEPAQKMDRAPGTTRARHTSLLPTPSKTPQKRTENGRGLSSIARNLFPARSENGDDAMPVSKKGKKYSGFTINTSEVDDENPIEIYTDSHERIPEVDEDSANPFYVADKILLEPTKRTSKRRKIAVAGEVDAPMEIVERRNDGLIYVFRGKKIFRKFGDNEIIEQESAEDDQLAQDLEPNLRRPLTRSSIKPRLLFPASRPETRSQIQPQATESEEEAVTDIEETQLEMQVTATPRSLKLAPTAPATPPTTARTTRKKDIGNLNNNESQEVAFALSPTHIDSGIRARLSPYETLTQSKPHSPSGLRKKRAGSLAGGTVKKVRG